MAWAGALVLAGSLAAGCAAPTHPRAARPQPVFDGGPLVFPTTEVASYEQSLGPEARYAWFEYGRNNDAVSARRDVPIEATRQWPVPPRPAERHVRFWYWVQR